MTTEQAKPWSYLELEPAPNAPEQDNPSGLYCPDCRSCGVSHCSQPEWCGGMRLMRPKLLGVAMIDRALAEQGSAT